ncbi:uncharacterized protein [Rutidosis leptorrhynchoides]|uniref:uncharacterized protein n=1 Tax=Rutidosis leptorrhynchoides TaxID=125765 RepID=UPI003A99F317
MEGKAFQKVSYPASSSSINYLIMKAISLNVRGFGNSKGVDKIGWVTNLIAKGKPCFLALQQTKLNCINGKWVMALWGSEECDFIQKTKVGKAGGQLLILNTDQFVATDVIEFDSVIGVRGIWKAKNCNLNVINIYGPQDDKNKLKLWNSLSEILEQDCDEVWLLCGDFNEVRRKEERLNCDFFDYRAKRFNDFIASNNLIELPLGGRIFTRVSYDGVKFSKLDRFFITEKFCTIWEKFSAVALERKHPDHCPIVLKDEEKNFGPKPFKVFDAWFDEKDVDQVVMDACKVSVGDNSRKDCLFRNKLNKVKEALRKWSYNRFGDLDGEIETLKGAASELEIRAETGGLNESETKIWQDTESPHAIKAEIFKHFKGIFSKSDYDRLSLEDLNYQVLSTDEVDALESPFNEKEIHEAILDCGSTKAPGPDGFNMRFIKKYWDVIKNELGDAIMWFWDKAEFSKGCNASFVTLIPKKKDPMCNTPTFVKTV